MLPCNLAGVLLYASPRHVGAAQAKWDRLTAADLSGIKDKSELIEQVAERYSLPREQAAKDVEVWASDLRLEPMEPVLRSVPLARGSSHRVIFWFDANVLYRRPSTRVPDRLQCQGRLQEGLSPRFERSALALTAHCENALRMGTRARAAGTALLCTATQIDHRALFILVGASRNEQVGIQRRPRSERPRVCARRDGGF